LFNVAQQNDLIGILGHLAWVSWIAAAFFLILWVKRLKQMAEKMHQSLADHWQWCRDHFDPENTLTQKIADHNSARDVLSGRGEASPLSVVTPIAEVFAACERLLMESRKVTQLEIKEQSARIAEQEGTAKSLRQKVAALQDDIKTLAATESLHWQQLRLMAPFKNQLTEILKIASDLQSTLEGVEHHCQEQRSSLKAWQEQILLKGSRKFIRSLAESPGREAHTTLLDDEIAELVTGAGTAEWMSRASSVLGDQIGSECLKVAQIVSHWEAMITGETTGEAGSHLGLWIAKAQRLVLMDTLQPQELQSTAEIFVNQLKVDSEILAKACPPEAEHRWISALMHLYGMFRDQGEPFSFKILTVLRFQDTNLNLLVRGLPKSASVDKSAPQIGLKFKTRSTLQMVEDLLAPWGVHGSFLSQITDECDLPLICLKWPLAPDVFVNHLPQKAQALRSEPDTSVKVSQREN
jgi:hypothetical protein